MKSNLSSQPRLRISALPFLKTALFVLLLSTFANGQTSNTDGTTPSGLKPGAPAGAYGLSGFENVNLYNGNLNFSLPLLQVGGRGSAGYTVPLTIEQKWRVERWAESFPGENPRYTPIGTWWTAFKPGYGPGVLEGRRGGYEDYPYEQYCGSQSVSFYNLMLTRLTFTAADGNEFELRDQLTHGEPKYLSGIPCEDTGNSRGTVFTTADGTGATFISDTTIYDYKYKPLGLNDQFRPSGYLLLRDGTRYRIENGLVIWLRDRNGNRLSFVYDGSSRVTTITDSLNRTVTFSYSGTNGFLYDLITYKGFGGQTRTIKVWKTNLGNVLRSGFALQTYAQLFPNMTGASSSSNFSPSRVSAVELPDGRSYQLRYNSYGELARVVLPTGGVLEYDWIDGNTLLDEGVIYRRVSERRVYASGTTLEGKTTYSEPGSGVQVDVRSFDSVGTLKGFSSHYFIDNALESMTSEYNTPISYGNVFAGRECTTDSFDIINNSPVLRQRTMNGWDTRVGHNWGSEDPRLVERWTVLVDSNQIAKQTFGYDDMFPFNNQNNVKEYEFGPGAPGALVRETRTTFITAASYTGTDVHLRSLVAQVSLYDAGGIERARTVNEFDNYATDTNHAALLNRAGISGLDAAFTSAYTTRGNVTGTTSYLLVSNAVTGSVTGYKQFDIAGNVVKAIDARGNATLLDYDDCFGAPDGNARLNSAPLELSTPGNTSFAFVTKITKPQSLISYSQSDYYLGRPVDGEDENGIVTSGVYSDALDRPTQIRRAAGTALTNQTTFGYDDTNRVVTTTSDLNANNDNILTSKTLYDGLGRTTETRQYEGGTNYIVSQVQYDFMGRAFKSSNPFRPWQSETPVWTTTGFDALGRVITITTPDSATVTTSYSGNTVTVTDQAGRARKSVTDALGRLTDVYEDPNALNYQTTYSYDVLDNLLKVSQGSQQRFFMYDSLKRLIRARNPEQSTNASLNLADALTGNSAWSIGYQYDANSNLTQKTDARGVISTYVYDALNRNTTIDYSDTSTINPDVKRFYDGATNGKGRFWYNYKGGDISAGSNVEHTAIDSYDALGRPLVERQLFKLNGTWSTTYQTSRGYNLAGGVTSQTYPSGHTVAYTYDSAGRTSAFTGYLGDGVLRTYATGINYSQWGSLSLEQFGAGTAVYHKLHYNVRGQLYDVRASNVNDEWGGELGALVNYYSNNWVHGGSGQDNNGNVLMSQTIINSFYMEDRYSYDALNRLASVGEYQNGATNTGNQLYTYDRWGNRAINPSSTVGLNKQFTVDTTTNRLGVPVGQAGVMTYDNAGNLNNDTYTGVGTRTYDAENRMTTAADNTNQLSRYTYDADGRRVRVQVASSQERWHVYGFDSELLAEYQAAAPAAAPEKEYGYRNGQMLIAAEPGAPSNSNVALASSGATVISSSTFSPYVAANVIDGSRRALNSTVWLDNTYNSFPDWIEVTFNGSKSVSEIDVVTQQDNPGNPVEPTLTQTFSLYGITAFDVQYWNGSAWVTVPAGSVTGNNKVWRQFTFAPITTTKIRVMVNGGADNAFSRVVEVEAWSPTTSSNIHWLVTDQLGTPRIILDQTGSLANVKRHDYLPFGEELFAGTGGRTAALGYAPGDSVRQQFTSKERDVETGLDYSIHRYYSSTQGRFTSADPYVIFFEMKRGRDAEEQVEMLNEYIAQPQNWARYCYGLNNPLRHLDPTGMRPPNKYEQAALDRLDQMAAQEGDTDLGNGLRAARATLAGIIDGLGKRTYDVGVNIAVNAILNIGSSNFSEQGSVTIGGANGGLTITFGPSESNKCNVFVAGTHADGAGLNFITNGRRGRGYPLIGGQPPVANWLGDAKDRQHLTNLAVVSDGSLRPGDIVAWRAIGGTEPGHSSVHIGGNVLVYAGGPPDGSPQAQTLNYVNGRLTGFLGGHEPYVVRRYNGKP